ncbi:Uncharacterised protein [Candidatus Venteria ishoeyi]|uniref:Uncharacterized protein n=1 Tax=Candidatus Venteria ishoeyi TaxID=1899563 RepID=A0A1H6F8G2_9GAMM|nr:Uncharacterised protein [Candidatus Venteria ishoeyi]
MIAQKDFLFDLICVKKYQTLHSVDVYYQLEYRYIFKFQRFFLEFFIMLILAIITVKAMYEYQKKSFVQVKDLFYNAPYTQ